MYQHFNKIFIGALLIFFDLNIGIDLLPDFIGVLLMIVGLTGLYEMSAERFFLRAKWCAISLLPFSVLGMFMTDISTQSFTVTAYIIASVVLMALIFFYMYSGALILLEKENYDEEHIKDIRFFRNVYVYANLFYALLISFNNYPSVSFYSTLLFITMIINVLISITWLFNLRKLRNCFEANDVA